MPRCLQCQEVYADQLRRCPYCGAGPETIEVGGDGARPRSNPVSARAWKRVIVRSVVVAVLLAVGAVVATVSLPRADRGSSGGSADLLPPDLPDIPAGPIAPPEEIAPGDPKDGFRVESAVVEGTLVRVTGLCSADAVVRIAVDGHPATIAPDGMSWTAVVPVGDLPLRVVAEGLDGTFHREEPTVGRAGGVDPEEAVRVKSHAEGQTVHVPLVRLEQDGGGEAIDAELPALENRISLGLGRFTLYRAPEGLVFLRVTDRGQRTFLRSKDGQEMVLVPSGLARRGAGQEPPHGPRHVVRVDGYLIDRTEVTCAQYAHFLQQSDDRVLRHREDPGVHLRPSGWTSDDPPPGHSDLPVTGVSWYAAFAYARWVDGRLPTEAEWERAAAGPNGDVFPWGNEFDALRCRALSEGPMRADSMPGGESSFSLLHMCGNAREWCLDRFDPRWYEKCSRTNPRWPSLTKHRVVRGGSYASSQQNLVLQFRDHQAPAASPPDAGFRVVIPWRQH